MEVAIEVGAEDVTEEVTNEEHSIKVIYYLNVFRVIKLMECVCLHVITVYL